MGTMCLQGERIETHAEAAYTVLRMQLDSRRLKSLNHRVLLNAVMLVLDYLECLQLIGAGIRSP